MIVPETIEVPESVADLSIDVADFKDGTSSMSRDELINQIDELVSQLLADSNTELPVSMINALLIGWMAQLDEDVPG